jgi:hypothetical protein
MIRAMILAATIGRVLAAKRLIVQKTSKSATAR